MLHMLWSTVSLTIVAFPERRSCELVKIRISDIVSDRKIQTRPL
jgi:hypothetical protein